VVKISNLRRRAARAAGGPRRPDPAPPARPTARAGPWCRPWCRRADWSPRSRRCPASGRPSAPRPAPAHGQAATGLRPVRRRAEHGESPAGCRAAPRNPARTTSWSSATTTEITALLSPGLAHRPALHPAAAAGWRTGSGLGRQQGLNEEPARPVRAPVYSAPADRERPPPAIPEQAMTNRPPALRRRWPGAGAAGGNRRQGRPRPGSRRQSRLARPRAPARLSRDAQPQRAGAVAQLPRRPPRRRRAASR